MEKIVIRGYIYDGATTSIFEDREVQAIQEVISREMPGTCSMLTTNEKIYIRVLTVN